MRCHIQHYVTCQIGLLVNKNLVISTVVPILAAVFLCFWVHILTVTLPDQIFQETNPSFVDINTRLQMLSHGIKSTDSETYLELKSAKSTVEEIDRNLNKKFGDLQSELRKHVEMLEDKLEAQEDSVEVFNSDVDALRTDITEEFSSFQSSIIEQFTEASIRYQEFMVPKIWLSLASLKDEDGGRARINDNLNLGLYREEGRVGERPTYKQVEGLYRLVFRQDHRWAIVSLDRAEEEEEEVVIQTNPKLPELSAKKWETPTHKVNVVHEIPCCKHLTMRHSGLSSTTRLMLGSLARGGRGVWQSKNGTTILFSVKDRQWQVRYIH